MGLCLLFMANPAIARVDSLGILEIKQRTYVLHEVESGETLFSLAKRYESNVDIIRAANDLDSVLDLGVILRIPIGSWWKALKPSGTGSSAVYHIVKPAETLYAISRSVSASIEEIRTWNDLNDETVLVGDSLIVGWTGEKPGRLYSGIFKEQLLDTNLNAAIDLGTPVTPKRMSFEETGLCVVDNAIRMDAYRKQALHKEIPVGTIVRVINPSNNRRVFVEIVGVYAEAEGLTDMMLSKSAAHQLKLDRLRNKVELFYYLEK